MAAIDDASQALNAAFSKLVEVAKDVMSLDVMTVTGTIKLEVPANAEARLDPTALYEALKGKVGSDDLRVLAMSHKDADCDAMVFVQANLSDAETKLLEAHREMFKVADQARLDLVKLLIDFVPRVKVV